MSKSVKHENKSQKNNGTCGVVDQRPAARLRDFFFFYFLVFKQGPSKYEMKVLKIIYKGNS